MVEMHHLGNLTDIDTRELEGDPVCLVLKLGFLMRFNKYQNKSLSICDLGSRVDCFGLFLYENVQIA